MNIILVTAVYTIWDIRVKVNVYGMRQIDRDSERDRQRDTDSEADRQRERKRAA